jgi:uncharacterized protein
MLTSNDYAAIRNDVLGILRRDLAPDLYYHSVEHSIDVEEQGARIARAEGINAPEDLLLLSVACLFHDSGFLFTYSDHEEAGCTFASSCLARYGISPRQNNTICGLIRATKIPQTPLTPLEKIICDADLDYLGRPDFTPISMLLFQELAARNMVKTEREWDLIQVKFIGNHHYFSNDSLQRREPAKAIQLATIKKRLDAAQQA